MLPAQVSYWTLQENKRHNIVVERETMRHNIADENQNLLNYLELVTHNRNVERETQRHNIASENYNNNLLAEQARHNLATEQVSWGQLEVSRYNAVTQRIGVENQYSLGIQANAIAARNATTNAYNAQTSRLSYQNSVRDTTNRIYQTEQSTAQGWNSLANQRDQTQIRQSQLGLDTSKFHWQKGMDIWSNINNSIRTLGDIANTASKFINPLQSIGG